LISFLLAAELSILRRRDFIAYPALLG